MQHLDDHALMELIAQNEQAALGELYDRYHRLVFSVAINIVGRREEAEEITLDVFLRVWEKAQGYQPERSRVYTWITRITRNKAIDLLRRESVRPLKDSVSWSNVYNEPITESDDPEAKTDLAIKSERVRQAVSSLPDNQKEVIALSYFKGLSHSEIASELDIPLGTAKARVRSGMQKLRALLHDE